MQINILYSAITLNVVGLTRQLGTWLVALSRGISDELSKDLNQFILNFLTARIVDKTKLSSREGNDELL